MNENLKKLKCKCKDCTDISNLITQTRMKAIDEAMEVVKNEIKECTDCESERISGEGECYGYTEYGHAILRDTLTALLALKNK